MRILGPTQVFLSAIAAIAFLLFSASPTSANYSVWDPPALYYNFEDAPGLQIKDRAGSNNLSLEAGSGSIPTFDQNGKHSRALKFDGDGGYAYAIDSTQFSQTGSFSVEAWVRFDSVATVSGTLQTVVAKWDETSDQRSLWEPPEPEQPVLITSCAPRSMKSAWFPAHGVQALWPTRWNEVSRWSSWTLMMVQAYRPWTGLA
ncbi:MAG TPA: hypothetical protein PKD55_04305 [Bellilinea sp.]|nr:hypothetical protein [Bellilinea sp.]